jgi:DNA-directed RNA polymerase specialized sigma24 family protein
MGKSDNLERELPAALLEEIEPAPEGGAHARGNARSGVFLRPGTSAQLGEIYREHAPFVRALVRRPDIHPDAADALVDAAFARVGRMIDEEEEVLAKPRAVLRAITEFLICNHLRDPRRKLDQREDVDLDAMPRSAPDPEQALLLARQGAEVHEVLRDMPESARGLLAEVYLNERAPVSIAAQRSVPVDTIYAKIRRAEARFARIFLARFKGVFFFGVLAVAMLLGGAMGLAWGVVRALRAPAAGAPALAAELAAPEESEDPRPAATATPAVKKESVKKETPRPAKPAGKGRAKP